VSIVPPANVVGCENSAKAEKFSLPAEQVGFGCKTPPLAAYETHLPWFANDEPSERTKFCQPPF
jgi:hypothetical protein